MSGAKRRLSADSAPGGEGLVTGVGVLLAAHIRQLRKTFVLLSRFNIPWFFFFVCSLHLGWERKNKSLRDQVVLWIAMNNNKHTQEPMDSSRRTSPDQRDEDIEEYADIVPARSKSYNRGCSTPPSPLPPLH